MYLSATQHIHKNPPSLKLATQTPMSTFNNIFQSARSAELQTNSAPGPRGPNDAYNPLTKCLKCGLQTELRPRRCHWKQQHSTGRREQQPVSVLDGMLYGQLIHRAWFRPPRENTNMIRNTRDRTYENKLIMIWTYYCERATSHYLRIYFILFSYLFSHFGVRGPGPQSGSRPAVIWHVHIILHSCS